MYTGEENGRCRLDPINLLKRKDGSTPITTPYCAEEKETKKEIRKGKKQTSSMTSLNVKGLALLTE